ncbi:hypothetical protein BDK51DRAFT_32609, partial [Blyttiomyces helicus]
MSEGETACQYCGISYLLLRKYERMEEHVLGLEKELSQRKIYADERPGLLAQIASLTETQRQSLETIAGLEEKAQAAREETRKAVLALDEMRTKHGRAQSVLDESARVSTARQERIAGLMQGLTDIRCELLQQRQQICNAKDEVKKSLHLTPPLFTGPRTINFSRECIQTLKPHIVATVLTLCKKDATAHVHAAQSRHQSEINALLTQLDSAREALRERSRHETSVSCTTSSGRGWSLRIMFGRSKNLEREREKFEDRNRDLDERLRAHKDQSWRETQGMQQHVIALEAKLYAKEAELREMLEKFRSERRSLEDGDAALGNANRALAQKDVGGIEWGWVVTKKARRAPSPYGATFNTPLAVQEQLRVLERTVRDLHQTMHGLRAERQKTVDAHQSRVKQLQDKFLEDIKEAGRFEAEKREKEVRRALESEKDDALKQLRMSLQMEFDLAQERLERQLDAMKVAKQHAELQASRECGRVEEEWSRRHAVVTEQMNKLRASNAADFEHYQSQIRALEEQVAMASTRAPTTASADHERSIQELRASLATRDAEIGFLKDTVRLECEERMGLVAELAQIRRAPSLPVVDTHLAPAGEPPRSKSGRADPPPPLDPEARSYQAMSKAANSIKVQKLAKSSSSRKLSGTTMPPLVRSSSSFLQS